MRSEKPISSTETTQVDRDCMQTYITAHNDLLYIVADRVHQPR